ncbi:MAG: hypothetical protein QNL29_06395 [Crocinitomicaceae bacterium]
MKSVKNTITLFALISAIVFSFNSFGQDDKALKKKDRLMSKAIKHNKKIPWLTYFVHSGDSLIQLFNVSVKKEASGVEIIGFETTLDSLKLEVYISYEKDPYLRYKEDKDKLNVNQIHLFVNGFTSNNGKIVILQSNTYKYLLFEQSRMNLKPWVILTIATAGGVAILTFVIVKIIAALDNISLS